MTRAHSCLTGFLSHSGALVSYEESGEGPPLVLVHGSFSDHVSNWELIKPLLEREFTVYAIARRGRGHTDRSVDHGVEDEALDVATLISLIGEPVYLLGHSYGAQAALSAAALIPERVRKLVLYEAPWPTLVTGAALAELEALAEAQEWDEFATTFFRDRLNVSHEEIQAVRRTKLWSSIIADARATLGDLRALSRHAFAPERFRSLDCPVLLQVGSESPRGLYVTDALAAVLPNAAIGALAGQAHEGMTTAPMMYAEVVTQFLHA